MKTISNTLKTRELAQEVLAWWEDEKCEGLEIAFSFKKKKPRSVVLAEQILKEINETTCTLPQELR